MTHVYTVCMAKSRKGLNSSQKVDTLTTESIEKNSHNVGASGRITFSQEHKRLSIIALKCTRYGVICSGDSRNRGCDMQKGSIETVRAGQTVMCITKLDGGKEKRTQSSSWKPNRRPE